jgi:hypothetical protein
MRESIDVLVARIDSLSEKPDDTLKDMPVEVRAALRRVYVISKKFPDKVIFLRVSYPDVDPAGANYRKPDLNGKLFPYRLFFAWEKNHNEHPDIGIANLEFDEESRTFFDFLEELSPEKKGTAHRYTSKPQSIDAYFRNVFSKP